MNDVHIIHVFSCVDKLIDLQTDHSPSHNIHARGVRLENVTMVTKLIPSLKNSRIATVKKWVSEERRGGSRTRRLFQKVLIFPSFRKIFHLGLIGKIIKIHTLLSEGV